MAQIYEFGMAGKACSEGYGLLVETVITCDAVIIASHARDDAIFVRGPDIYSRPGYFEFARFENAQKRADERERRLAYLRRRVPCILRQHPYKVGFVVSPKEEPTFVLGEFSNEVNARRFCSLNYLPLSEAGGHEGGATPQAAVA